MPHLQAHHGDLTKVRADAIVNAANTSLLGGGGVDGAIHRAGGSAILEDCRAVVARQGGCKPGQAVITGAGRLQAKHVIHTVGPVWTPANAPEHDATLASCYTSSLALAQEHRLESIAFPSISTGAYRFPPDRAARVAFQAVVDHFRALPPGPASTVGSVLFVCFDEASLAMYESLIRELPPADTSGA